MTTTYRDRIQKMCDRLDIANPIQEASLAVEKIRFTNQVGERTNVEASDMNRAGRLFFQHHVEQEADDTTQVHGMALHVLQLLAKPHFKEKWDDAEEKNRTLITALKSATMVVVYWKPKS